MADSKAQFHLSHFLDMNVIIKRNAENLKATLNNAMTLCHLQAWTLRQFTSKKEDLFIPIWENSYTEQPPSPLRKPGGFNDFFSLRVGRGENYI